MNPNNIGWDAHLDRELDRYHEEGEAYMVQRRVEELQADIQRLDGLIYDADEEGNLTEAARLQAELEEAKEELNLILHS